MKRLSRGIINYSLLIINSSAASAQLSWVNVDSLYQPLPATVHVYKTTDQLDGKPNIAFYVIADLKDRKLLFDADTTFQRRFTPVQFYQNNNKPLVVVNTTFFSFATNQNLNVVIKDGKMVGYNIHSIPGRGKDTLTYRHPFGSAIGISKKRKADVAWIFSDSSRKFPYSSQHSFDWLKDSSAKISFKDVMRFRYRITQKIHPRIKTRGLKKGFKKWKTEAAVGGGPVLLQAGKIDIANNEELKFTGSAINDKHPRTAMGYTNDNKIIILVVQGRFPGVAEGATLGQEAKMLQDLGCWEALNLDGGGSSCMLINGKETIKPSDPIGQRAVPAVFIIQKKGNK